MHIITALKLRGVIWTLKVYYFNIQIFPSELQIELFGENGTRPAREDETRNIS